jgi:hypothetical protein
MPMREVLVCLKNAPNETNPEILAFRKELDERQDIRVFHYSNTDELGAHVTDACNAWARALIESGTVAGISSEGAGGGA